LEWLEYSLMEDEEKRFSVRVGRIFPARYERGSEIVFESVFESVLGGFTVEFTGGFSTISWFIALVCLIQQSYHTAVITHHCEYHPGMMWFP
jgi:hypothetical protein